ncbi:hypothetical protein SO802_019156 [Lithocarpus litseifolius]|uniref:Uncharacterized protein n=1 Tax=Lithocarpus litseifolius TaxID=425828 RepID=A0AAW2CP32_9ROSI
MSNLIDSILSLLLQQSIKCNDLRSLALLKGGEVYLAQDPASFRAIYLIRENCGGTLAPLPPKDDGTASNIMECNVCGNLKDDQMTDASGVEDEHPMDD